MYLDVGKASGTPSSGVLNCRGAPTCCVAQAELADGLALPNGVALVTTAESADAAEHLARVETRAVVLRPDRYTLGAANSREELTDLMAAILPNPMATSESVRI